MSTPTWRMSTPTDSIEVAVTHDLRLRVFMDHQSNLGWISLGEFVKDGLRSSVAVVPFDLFPENLPPALLRNPYPRISLSKFNGDLTLYVGVTAFDLPLAALLKVADFLRIEIPVAAAESEAT